MERHNKIKYLIDYSHLDSVESKAYIKHLFKILKLKSEKKDDADFEFLLTHYDSKNNIKFKELKITIWNWFWINLHNNKNRNYAQMERNDKQPKFTNTIIIFEHIRF